MTTLKKLTVLFGALLFLSACSSTRSGGGYESSDLNPLQSEFRNSVGDRVYFAYDSSDLSELSKSTLKKQVEWLSKNSNIHFVVEGHCDERGTREYNYALGEKRADSVKKFLVSHGINASRIETVSYGKDRPEDTSNNENAWCKNRRGVVVLKK